MSRTVTVKGIGSAMVKPDFIELRCQIKTERFRYEEMMKKVAEYITGLATELGKEGFDREKLKTTEFKVHRIYDEVNDEGGNKVKRFVSYQCCHTMKLSFALDFPMLSRVIKAVMRSRTEPEIDISFTVRDKGTVRHLILEDAIKNAMVQAKMIVDIEGEKLGNMLHAECRWENIETNPFTNYEYLVLLDETSYVESMKAEDIQLSDSVTLTWEIL